MSLVSVIQDVVTRIATEFNTVRTEIDALGSGTGTKISDLTDIGAATQIDDLYVIVDTSGTATRKITVGRHESEAIALGYAVKVSTLI